MKKLLLFTLLLNSCLVFSQTIYKKGYITNLENETIEGFVILQKSSDYYHQVIFTTDKKSEPRVYTPEMIKGYGYSKTSVFEAIDIPAIEKGFLVEDEPLERKFLEVFSTSESLTFYKLYQNGEKKYFIKNEFEELIPLVFDKKDVDKYKINTGTYKLPSGEIININESAIVTAQNGKIYTLESQKLYEVQPVFKNELQKIATSKGCNVEDNLKTMKLSQASFSSFSKKIGSCTNESFQFLSKKISPQISVLAIGSTYSYIRNIHIGYEYGLLMELRENSISQNYSFGFGYFQNDVTNNLRNYQQGEGTFNPNITQIKSSTILLKFSYHLRRSKKIRPFISLNSRILDYESTIIALDTNRFLDKINERDYFVGGSIGADYYFFRYFQLRAEVDYSKIISYQIGLGISIY